MQFQKIIEPFKALKNRTFALLYTAQTISLIGDAFTWVGLALLSYEMDKERSSVILATALTLRVTAFIIFSPFAGVLADRMARKKILYITHFCRMAIVCCLPFVTTEIQIYVLLFLLNMFNAFFTPTYRAIIPHVTEERYFREAVGLSTATYQVLGILGPGLAGIVAVWFGARTIFFIDTASFIIAAILILMIPVKDLQKGVSETAASLNTWTEVWTGIRQLFGNKVLRFALSIEFVSAIAGAQILVNSVSLVRTRLQLNDDSYGWIMAMFGIGAAVAAFTAGILDRSKTRSTSLILGFMLLGFSILCADNSPFGLLMVLWLIAGLGQSLSEMPSETLIAEQIADEHQGKVYGSHFAFSHLWWAIAYPIAGFMGKNYPQAAFFYGGLATLCLGLVAILFFKFKKEI